MFWKVVKQRWHNILLFSFGLTLVGTLLFGALAWFTVEEENRNLEYFVVDRQLHYIVITVNVLFGIVLVPIAYGMQSSQVSGIEKTKRFASDFKVGDTVWAISRNIFLFKMNEIVDIMGYTRYFGITGIDTKSGGIEVFDFLRPSIKYPKYYDLESKYILFKDAEELTSAINSLKVEYLKELEVFDKAVSSILEEEANNAR